MFSDQDVDRELKAALSVSPSPEFEARVLQRVGTDRSSRWPAHYGWFAAAASLVIAAGVFYAMNRTAVVVVPAAAPKIVERTAPPAIMPPPEAPVRKSATAPPRVETVRAARRAPRAGEPEVLVPLNQMEAVRRLIRAVNEGRIEVPAEPPPGPMAPPPAVTVTPVVIEPIPLAPLGPAGETATPFIRRLK